MKRNYGVARGWTIAGIVAAVVGCEGRVIEPVGAAGVDSGHTAGVDSGHTVGRDSGLAVGPDSDVAVGLNSDGRAPESTDAEPSQGTGAASQDGGPISVPLPGTGSPATAADGWILFDSDVQDLVRHIFAVRADGSGLTQLTSGASNDSEAVVSPDGSTIAFTSDRAGATQIFTMNVSTKAINPLGTPANSGQAAFSPDGSTLTFFSSDASNDFIYLVNADGTSPRQVIVSPNGGTVEDYWEHPVFTLDGNGLLADRYNLIDVFDLMGNVKLALLPGESQESLWPAIQRNNANVAFVTSCSTFDDSIVVVSIGAPFSSPGGYCAARAASARNLGPLSHPSWGPGTLITFAHQSSAGVSRIVVGDASNPGAEGVELVQDQGDQENPFWAPSTFQP
jgi:hypothetical protein